MRIAAARWTRLLGSTAVAAVLGLSLAGYDVLVSLALAIVALWGARASFALKNRSE